MNKTALVNGTTSEIGFFISKEKDAINMFTYINKEIDKLIEPYKEQFSDEQLEEVKTLHMEQL